MQELGRVKFVQITPRSLMSGEKNNRVYSPEPLLRVEQLLVGTRGSFGLLAHGQRVMDHHHPDHPQSHNRGENGLSLGFTEHYREMRARFGDHMFDGCGAENIIVETDRRLTAEALQPYVLIHHKATNQWVILSEARVAEPCDGFAGYATQRSQVKAEIRAALQFLHQGTRGFYLKVVETSDEPLVQAGDVVFTSTELPAEIVPALATARQG